MKQWVYYSSCKYPSNQIDNVTRFFSRPNTISVFVCFLVQITNPEAVREYSPKFHIWLFVAQFVVWSTYLLRYDSSVKPKPGIQTPWCCPSLGIRFPDVAQAQELYWQVLPHARNPTPWCCSTSGILLSVVATPRNQTSRYCSTLRCCPTLGVKLPGVAQPSKSIPQCAHPLPLEFFQTSQRVVPQAPEVTARQW